MFEVEDLNSDINFLSYFITTSRYKIDFFTILSKLLCIFRLNLRGGDFLPSLVSSLKSSLSNAATPGTPGANCSGQTGF